MTGGIIALLCISILLYILAGALFDTDQNWSGIAIGLLASLVLFFVIIGIQDNSKSEGYNLGHKDGQIDAINGKIYYHLKTKPDSTREWVLIKQQEIK